MTEANGRARPRYLRWVLVFCLLACLVVCVLVGGALFLRLRTTRGTLVPSGPARTISSEQAQLLVQELARHPAHALTVKTDASDREANQFAHQLYDALRNSQWQVEISADAAAAPAVGTGLCIAQTGEDARPAYPDPRQDPYFFLPGAFGTAHIDVTGASGQASGPYKLYLVVGHRELKMPAQPDRPTLRSGARRFLRNIKRALRRI